VELLVVIAIIGILIALLLPAVQAAREAARRMQCSNNLKQVALACHNYESSYKAFPAGLSIEGSAASNHGYGYSAFVQILPFMESSALYDQIQVGVPTQWAWSNTACRVIVPGLRCPSEPNYSTPVDGASAPSNYAVSAGDYCITARWEINGWEANANADFSRGAFQPRKLTGLGAITDGTSNTMMVSERAIGLPNSRAKGGIAQDVATVFPDTTYNSCEKSGFNPSACAGRLDPNDKTVFKGDVYSGGSLPMGRWYCAKLAP
jgi:type II secretory pathway pseudopilin PulG